MQCLELRYLAGLAARGRRSCVEAEFAGLRFQSKRFFLTHVTGVDNLSHCKCRSFTGVQAHMNEL